MDDARRKVLDDAEAEINRFTGGDTQYLAWLGKTTAAVTSTVVACRKLMDLAQEQGRPFEAKIKSQLVFLEWFGGLASMTAVFIGMADGVISSNLGKLLPCAVLEAFIGMWVNAHRLAHALWRDSGEVGLLWKDVPGSIN